VRFVDINLLLPDPIGVRSHWSVRFHIVAASTHPTFAKGLQTALAVGSVVLRRWHAGRPLTTQGLCSHWLTAPATRILTGWLFSTAAAQGFLGTQQPTALELDDFITLQRVIASHPYTHPSFVSATFCWLFTLWNISDIGFGHLLLKK
jgi:hypothetical protein